MGGCESWPEALADEAEELKSTIRPKPKDKLEVSESIRPAAELPEAEGADVVGPETKGLGAE